MKKSRATKKRVIFIDELRGVCILLVVIYHFAYDVSNLINLEIFYSSTVDVLRDVFAGLLIFISGISCAFSKNNLMRGIKCLCFGLLITLITCVFVPDQLIIFGILHMLGTCMIIYGLLGNVIERVNKKILLIVAAILFILTKGVTSGYVGLGSFIITLPRWIYNIKILMPLGFVRRDFLSADYYPLLPWLFLFIAGTVIGRFGIEKGFPNWMYMSRCRFLSMCGRNTLIIYLLHQPLIYLFFYIYSLIK